MATELGYWVIGLLTAYQLYVTLRVILSALYSRTQKGLQAAVIWLVPLLGALVCHIVLSSATRHSRPNEAAFTSDEGGNPSGIGSAGPHV